MNSSDETDVNKAEQALEQISQVIEILSRVQEHGRFLLQAMALCNELSGYFRAEQVSLGVLSGNRVKLVAMDHTDNFSRKMGHVRAIEDAMEESLDQGTPVIYPASPEAAYFCRMAETLSRESGTEQVVVVPLFFEQRPVMALVIEFGLSAVFTREGLGALRLLTRLVAPRLYEKYLMDCWFGIRLARDIRRRAASWLGPEQTWIKLAVLGVILIIMFSVCFKGRYLIEAPLVIESAKRRIITAPCDGFIDSVDVLPGDAVKANKSLLLRLDTRDLRLKIAEAQAEQFTYRKEADLARSEERVAEAQVASGKERQATARLDLLTDWLSRSNIISPVNGFIRSKDLHCQIGRGVSAGEPLLEVEDVASLKAVVRVAETDVVDLSVKQHGEVIITAYPNRKILGVVERIVPSATVVNGSNVFEAWVSIDTPPAWLRPAMEGEARIEAGRRLYIWLWMHRLSNWLRMWLWI